jgi:methionyl-tRNA formyltransferase
MNIVFMGTPEFAVPSLKKLIQFHNVTAVFTQPDRPKGRGHKLTFSPVKKVAVENGIKVYQPQKLKNEPETIKEIEALEPDFIVVVAFGQILTKSVLDIPKYGCINLHASLLPKYRGAAPINWCIINGEEVSGNTTMLMDVGIDTGDMLLKSEIKIHKNMTAGMLHDALMEDGGELLNRTIMGLVEGSIVPQKQEDSESTYAPMLTKETGKIDWTKSAEEINNLVRGLNPWPITHTSCGDKTVKIYETEVIKGDSIEPAGTIAAVDNQGIKVSTGENYILIKKIQFPNGKPMRVEEYIKGNNIDKGIVLI